jgi:hypothetical protein
MINNKSTTSLSIFIYLLKDGRFDIEKMAMNMSFIVYLIIRTAVQRIKIK